MPVITLPLSQPFSLDQTLGCGQVFRWDRAPDGTWMGIVDSHIIRIRQEGQKLRFSGAPTDFIRHYFSLDVDLAPILASIDNDPVIHTAIAQCQGLRLVRQPPWECTISYICSTNSNIPTIRRRIASLAEQFGQPVESAGGTFYTFPEPSCITCKGHDGLTVCRLGYRQPYVYGTSCTVTDVECWEDTIRRLPHEDARKELMKLHGIGPKAADCILLFAFQKYEAFPVDVWIRRIMQEHYLPELATGAPLTTREYDTIRTFAREHFGGYCGWAQEYLYAGRLV
ncbi:DNA glycosylase [Methanoregula sp.]|uniref:DNA-3-methyladenine glycosylase family protein n=1 Tax=Methanoregula sp. TaxID=2052170 RepID=UPI00236962F1|nr:DNA glycosylase [Methanoregula sp.]MDD1686617.1 8-oxoguanine DNA glycosylase [Methanoregula sp.]